MPSVHLTLTPRGRMTSTAKAQRRHYAPTVKDENSKALIERKSVPASNTTQHPLSDTTKADDYISFADTVYDGRFHEDDFRAPDNDNGKNRKR